MQQKKEKQTASCVSLSLWTLPHSQHFWFQMRGDFSPRSEVLYGTSWVSYNISDEPFWHQRPVLWKTIFFSTDLREMRDGSGSNVNNGSDGEWRMKLPLLASCLSLALRPRSWRPLSYNVIQFWHCLSPQDKGSVLWDCLPTSWLQMPVLSPDHHLCF